MPVKYHVGKFPPPTLDWPRLIPLIGSANAAVARYDGLLQGIPNPRVLLSPLTTQEAVLSSRIEGTQATMGEVLEYEAGADDSSPSKTQDIYEVLNYRSAVREAEQLLKELPLSQRVLQAAHRVLLSGVRGQNKAPGEYRRIPNWIGPPNCTEETARFVPISAADLPEGMGRWEKYLHEPGHDKLLQLAIAHAEFEALHPFLDGNGRLGRMLVPLFLWQTGVIHMPMFYLSAYLEERRDEYYDRLLAVSNSDDWTGWCEFFLKAIEAQANENMGKVRQILALYDELKLKVVDWTHSQYAVIALDWIFERPIFSG
ncbi:MAG: Fic family protein, partial [Alcaligenaceae bacterium]